jgi:hypothetical protein
MTILMLRDRVTNAAAAFYDTDINSDIPEGCIEISREARDAYCETQGLKSFAADGTLLDEPPIPPAKTLEVLFIEQSFLIAEVRDRIDEATDRDEPTTPLVAYRKSVRLALDGVTDPATFKGWPLKP